MRTATAAVAAMVFFKGVMAGYAEVCLVKSRGCIDYRVTKDCCAAVGGQQHFDEIDHICKSDNLCGGNSVNIGAMVRCCEGRGAGSRELKRSKCNANGAPAKC